MALARLLYGAATIVPRTSIPRPCLRSFSLLSSSPSLSRPRTLLALSLSPSPHPSLRPSPSSLIQVRHLGNEYQPSQRKRKRKFGFLTRLRSRNGYKTLMRRKAKGRRFLSH